MNVKRIVHSLAGLAILVLLGSLMLLDLPDSFLAQLVKALIVAQALIVLGAVNLYIMVKTPFRDVISECADMLPDVEQRWRAGKLTQPGAQVALAAAIEATGRVISIMLFAGLGLAFVAMFIF